MSEQVVLEAKGLTKSFGPVVALRSVDIEFRRREIHAVLGENGAGKSTLMNVLAGFLTPDSGSVNLLGQPLRLGNPVAARAAGIAMVHQHFMLVPAFTVAENLALARLEHLRGTLQVEDAACHALEIGESLGWKLDPHALTGQLAVGVQQRVEILKALATDAPILILDEPTAVLSAEETEELFQVLRKLREQGKTIILIAHKLAEIVSVASWATVLRQGAVVASQAVTADSADALATAMIGEPLKPSAPRTTTLGNKLLTVQELRTRGDRGEPAVQGISFTVRSGEVFGIGGVDGNGQVQLAEALVGVRPFEGSVEVQGPTGYIPQDRQTDGLALPLSIEENFLIALPPESNLAPSGRLRWRAIRDWSQELVQRFAIKTPDLKTQAGQLSGGNQQKVVVARVLDREPKVIVAVNPTRGLDFHATDFVHQALRDAATNGAAVVLISTDRDELAAVADRIQYLSAGRLYDSERALAGVPT